MDHGPLLSLIASQCVAKAVAGSSVLIDVLSLRCAGTPVDVWALACLAFEILMGLPLFRSLLAEDVERQILSEEPLIFPAHNRAGIRISATAFEFMSVRHLCTLPHTGARFL